MPFQLVQVGRLFPQASFWGRGGGEVILCFWRFRDSVDSTLLINGAREPLRAGMGFNLAIWTG